MAITPYANFYLANEIEDLYASHLDLQRFATVDNTLELTEGMKKTINRYTATSGVEKLTKGNGNTKDIVPSFTPHNYNILLAQTRFPYYDEDQMTDSTIIQTGIQKAAADLFDETNKDLYAEWLKTTNSVSATSPDFGAFVDAASLLKLENLEDQYLFGIVSPTDVGKVRKALKDDLKYVEAFVRQGYIGTVGGVNLFTKKNATVGTIAIATQKAVTIFNKKGVEVETERVPNTRNNILYARKYYVAALTDANYAAKIVLSTSASSGS